MSAPARPRPGSPAAWAKALGLRRGFLLITPLPVLLGALACASLHHPVAPGPVLVVLLGAWLIHAGTNLANDYWDHVSGNDDLNVHLTPFSGGTRTIQEGLLEPRVMRRAALALLAAGVGVLGLLAARGDGRILPLGVAGAAFGWFYTAPPLQLAYRGLGELAVGLNFGPFLAACASLAGAGEAPARVWLAGLLLSCLSVAVLLVNEVPDTPADRHAGKNHLLVRFGERAGVRLAAGLLAAFHGLLLAGVLTRALPVPALVGLLGIPATARAARLLPEALEDSLLLEAGDPLRYAPFLPAIRATLGAKFTCGWLLALGLLLEAMR